MPLNPIELLAPARDLDCGRAAIDCGADAVYIGAPRFGAREAAGNTLDDIAALVEHAHKYWARVYVTLNTLLRDDELDQAVALAHRLAAAGIDGLIVQDVGLLECDLPPLPLIASTQMHNATPERVAFLEKVGFRRAILARELDLEQIRAVRAAAPSIELECFVHGALCVGMSGQCYLSFALGGRSGNRGACAQPCRKRYALLDAGGEALAEGHLLSLKDLSLAAHLGELLDAGVGSFKIEGRLKDRAYVMNAVAHLRARLDAELAARGLRRASSGASAIDFTPDPAKTFNRGFSNYFLHGRGGSVGEPRTPKTIGEEVGPVVAADRRGVTVETALELHPGDGLCFFGGDDELRGTALNGVMDGPAGRRVLRLANPEGLAPGMVLYRNHDHEFLTRLKKSRPERRVAVRLALGAGEGGGLRLTATDEDGVMAEATLPGIPEPARNAEAALATLERQLARTGETAFACAGVTLDLPEPPFLPVAALNELRRAVLERLVAAREAARPRPHGGVLRNEEPYPEVALDYRGNALNRRAADFYRRHRVASIGPAAESGLDLRGRVVMTTRYCLKHPLGLCPRDGGEKVREPLTLVDEEGHVLEPHFDCARCGMTLTLRRARA